MGGFGDFLFGNQSKMQGFNQDSLNFLQQILGGGGLNSSPLFGAGNSFLQSLLSGSPEAFQSFEAPYMQNFQQNIAPGIAERFAGMGTGGGASSSSALQNSLAQAGRGLQTDLASMRSGLQMQALPQALQYSQQPFSNMLQAAGMIPNQYYEKPGQQGFVQSGFNSLMSGVGKGLTGGF